MSESLTPAQVSQILTLAVYYTVCIPWVPYPHATEWHPTDPTGPFAVLTRGAFPTYDAAIDWARTHLDGAPYSVKPITLTPPRHDAPDVTLGR